MLLRKDKSRHVRQCTLQKECDRNKKFVRKTRKIVKRSRISSSKSENNLPIYLQCSCPMHFIWPRDKNEREKKVVRITTKVIVERKALERMKSTGLLMGKSVCDACYKYFRTNINDQNDGKKENTNERVDTANHEVTNDAIEKLEDVFKSGMLSRQLDLGQNLKKIDAEIVKLIEALDVEEVGTFSTDVLDRLLFVIGEKLVKKLVEF